MASQHNCRALVESLADGRFWSGQALAKAMGVSRAAVWKRIQALKAEYGLDIDAVRGKGYRLQSGLQLLSKDKINAALDPDVASLVSGFCVQDILESTNSWLMKRAAVGAASGEVCLAECQTGGRGRHGRQWVSPYGTNVYLSVLWRFAQSPIELSGLSLACGVAVARVLADLGLTEVSLKWPNDVLWRRKKLAGLLLEVGGEASGPCYVVVGIGLNTRIPSKFASGISQPWADLAAADPQSPIERNTLCARLIVEVIRTMLVFTEHGLPRFLPEWQRFDLLQGNFVNLALGSTTLRGEYLGIADDGALKLKVDGIVRHFTAGEVSFCRTAT